MRPKAGFTLLEVIIVIIVIGVLASLALPRMFRMVEAARAAEALTFINQIRSSMEQCYLRRGGSYATCQGSNVPGAGAPPLTLHLNMEQEVPNAHFYYSAGGGQQRGYCITAFRNTHEYGGGEPAAPYVDNCNTFICVPVPPWNQRSIIHFCQETNGEIRITGHGFYQNISL